MGQPQGISPTEWFVGAISCAYPIQLAYDNR